MTNEETPSPQHEGQPSSRRRKPGETWQGFVERQIQEAQAQGAFDNLPGHGKPLPPEALNPYEGSRALAHKILKDHGFAPEWIELDKEIRRELEAARRRLISSYQRYGPDSSVWQRAVDRFTDQVAALNAKIDLYNLKAPAMRFRRRRIALADEILQVERGSSADD